MRHTTVYSLLLLESGSYSITEILLSSKDSLLAPREEEEKENRFILAAPTAAALLQTTTQSKQANLQIKILADRLQHRKTNLVEALLVRCLFGFSPTRSGNPSSRHLARVYRARCSPPPSLLFCLLLLPHLSLPSQMASFLSATLPPQARNVVYGPVQHQTFTPTLRYNYKQPPFCHHKAKSLLNRFRLKLSTLSFY